MARQLLWVQTGSENKQFEVETISPPTNILGTVIIGRAWLGYVHSALEDLCHAGENVGLTCVSHNTWTFMLFGCLPGWVRCPNFLVAFLIQPVTSRYGKKKIHSGDGFNYCSVFDTTCWVWDLKVGALIIAAVVSWASLLVSVCACLLTPVPCTWRQTVGASIQH